MTTENDWIKARFPGINFWLGGFQDHQAPGYSEPFGGWTWVTGEAFSYTNWNGGEPNDYDDEDYLEFVAATSADGNMWNDAWDDNDDNRGYVVEWDTTRAIPVFGPLGLGALLAFIAAAGVILLRLHRG